MSEIANQTVSVEMVTDVCIFCGVPYSMPKLLDDVRRKDGRKIHCPNGHKQYYTSEKVKLEQANVRADKLAEDNERLKGELAKRKLEIEHSEAKREVSQ